MKKFLPLMALSGLFIALFAGTRVHESFTVHFAPTGKDRLLTQEIVRHIQSAEREITIAMYTFTSVKIARALADAAEKKKISVRLLLDSRTFSFQDQDNPAIKLLQDRGIPVKKVVLDSGGKSEGESPKFHHKFCVIDKKIVLTGSLNWTVLADESNYENMVIVESENVARTFLNEFDKVWNDPKITR